MTGRVFMPDELTKDLPNDVRIAGVLVIADGYTIGVGPREGKNARRLSGFIAFTTWILTNGEEVTIRAVGKTPREAITKIRRRLRGLERDRDSPARRQLPSLNRGRE